MTAPARAISPDVDFTTAPAPTLVEHARRLIARNLPTTSDRRCALRQLATDVDSYEPDLVRVLVATLADLGINNRDRDERWDDLVNTCALLTGLGTGDITPKSIAPGANPNCAYTVAAEVLEQDIRTALDQLVLEP